MTVNDSIIDQYAALDQAESQSRSDNIKFGIRQRMRSGKTLLNHTRFLGYTKGPDGVLQIVPEEAEIVRKIFDLYVQGNGVRKIKKLMQKTYTPDFLTGKKEKNRGQLEMYLVENAHEPLLAQEMFDRVQQIKGQIKRQEQRKTSQSEVTQRMGL